MDSTHYFLVIWVAICCSLPVLRHYRLRNYDPNKVIVDLGNTVCINYSAIGRKEVPKLSIVKIQYALTSVSLFNSSDNALDIHVPKKILADKVFERAISVFPHAQVVKIDC